MCPYTSGCLARISVDIIPVLSGPETGPGAGLQAVSLSYPSGPSCPGEASRPTRDWARAADSVAGFPVHFLYHLLNACCIPGSEPSTLQCLCQSFKVADWGF